MISANQLNFDNFRNIKKVLIIKHLFKIYLALRFFSSNFLGLYIFLILFLEIQLHLTNTDFKKSFVN